jgi:ElaB/YqjD/DUF883 family membrane-anchored ribosome-binding protein
MANINRRIEMAEDLIRKELDALKHDIAQLRKDIGGLTDAVKTVASDKVNATKSRTRERASSAVEEIESKLEELLGQGSSKMHDAEQKIADHPGASLLTAFGIGFVIAKLMDMGGRH